MTRAESINYTVHNENRPKHTCIKHTVQIISGKNGIYISYIMRVQRHCTVILKAKNRIYFSYTMRLDQHLSNTLHRQFFIPRTECISVQLYSTSRPVQQPVRNTELTLPMTRTESTVISYNFIMSRTAPIKYTAQTLFMARTESTSPLKQ